VQYDAKSPSEYLGMLEPDWRRDKLLELRALLKKYAPQLGEGVKYGMLAFTDDKGRGFALNAQKHSVNLYVGAAKKVDPDGALLAGLDVGKGCIRFKKSTAVADTRIEAFIRKAADMLRKGEDVGC